MTSHDPDLEERAQAAISSYFKENIVLPSPMDCQLRKQKIIFSSKKATRDGVTQTLLTFPPILPKQIEALLAPFFSYDSDQQQSPTLDCDTTVDYEARDASLRRKLFNISVATSSDVEEQAVDIDLGSLSPPPRSPESVSFTLVLLFFVFL